MQYTTTRGRVLCVVHALVASFPWCLSLIALCYGMQPEMSKMTRSLHLTIAMIGPRLFAQSDKLPWIDLLTHNLLYNGACVDRGNSEVIGHDSYLYQLQSCRSPVC